MGSTWATVTIRGAWHANVVEGRTVIPGGPSREGIERMRAEFGEDSETCGSRVLSEFPTQPAEGLFDRGWLEVAIVRWEKETLRGEGEPVAAPDVSRYGGDGKVLMIRHGPLVVLVEWWGGISTLNTARRLDPIVGLGAGCVEALKETR